MSRYYYFAATLPALQFGASQPLSSEEFLRRARRHLSRADYRAIEGAVLNPSPDEAPATGGSLLLERHNAWERALRNALAVLRAERLGREAEAYLRPALPMDEALAASASETARAAFGAASPLEGELAIERARWSFLDRECPFQTFDLESLVAYRLELQVLERVALFLPERGEKEYREVYAAILRPAQSSSETGVLQ
jgi:hypothetical protein